MEKSVNPSSQGPLASNQKHGLSKSPSPTLKTFISGNMFTPLMYQAGQPSTPPPSAQAGVRKEARQQKQASRQVKQLAKAVAVTAKKRTTDMNWTYPEKRAAAYAVTTVNQKFFDGSLRALQRRLCCQGVPPQPCPIYKNEWEREGRVVARIDKNKTFVRDFKLLFSRS